MKDVQNQKGEIQIDINKVGIRNLSIPLIISDKKNKTQNTIANINMYVNLPKKFKGTHMSRFLEIIYRYSKQSISIKDVHLILNDIKKKFESNNAHINIYFKYFLEKQAPVSKKKSLLDYDCAFLCEINNSLNKTKISINVPITTLCPCSKKISKYGAHNQRGLVKLIVLINKFIWIEDLINLIEKQASCEIYPLLKRPDEAFVTEKAYMNPNFVEDIVRKIAQKIKKDKRIDGFSIECENFESIHNHSAYANITENLK